MSTVRIQVRRGTAAQWTSVNPILAAGEMGVESDSNLFKFGNGSSTWTALSYANNSDVAIGEISQDAINTALTMGSGLSKTYNDGANTITINVDSNVVALKSYVDAQVTGLSNTVDSDFIPASDRGIAGGVASLNSSGKVPASELDITETVQDVVGSAIVAGAGITKTYDDAANTITIISNISNGNGITATNGTGTERIFTLADSIAPATAVQTALVTATTVNAGTVTTTGNGTVGGNLTITGNLTVNGTSTTVNSTNVSYDDPMIYMGDGNQSNVLDLGLVAAFNDGTYQHAGLVRDASDGKWKLFSGVTAEPGTTVDFTTYTKDTLEIGALFTDGAKIGNVTNDEIQYLDGVTSSIQTQLNNKMESIADASVTAAKLATNSVTSAKIVDGAVSTAKIADGSITSAKLTANVISQSHLSDDSVGTAEILGAAVTTEKIANDAVTSMKIAAGAVGTSQLATDAVSGIKIVDGAITSAKIANDSIVNADINSAAAIDKTKIAGTAVTVADSGTVTNTMLAGSIAQDKVVNLTSDLAAKATIDAPTFTGVVTLPATTSIGLVDATELGYINGVTSSIQTQLTALGTADTTHAALTANVHGIADTAALATKSYVDTADALKANLASPTFTGTVAGITKSMVGLGSVDNTADTAKPISTATQTALDLKAPLASPALTGVPTAPTAAAGTSTTQVATTAFVGTAVSNLVASSPAALDTLNELATALGNDASFSTTITNSIALKSPIASPTFTGTVTAPAITATALITASASGVAFTDGTQTKEGVPSRTPILSKTADYTLSALTERDALVEMNSASATTLTIPANSAVAFPAGTSIDVLRVGAGAVTISPAAGVTLNYTPGNKLRAQWSGATIFKRSTDTWVVYGDLSA